MENEIRILAVDDEPDLRSLLRILLERRGYAVTEAASGLEAVELVRDGGSFDLIIMDIMMPDLSGVEACRQIREFCLAPVLFLSAKTRLEDKTQAYESGGDDYLPKPFSKAELLLKVDSMLRRYRIYGKEQERPSGDLVLDEEGKYFLRGGEMLDLTEKEFAILQYFYTHRGQVVDVQGIYEAVWKEQYMAPSNNTVMVHILNLRKKLEADPANPKLIRTIWGRGYRLE